MKTEQVRCWMTGVNRDLFITYPESESGHRLICCKNCGCVHAVNVMKQLYIEPDLEKHLRDVKCSKCDHILAGNWVPYPDRYLDEAGVIRGFERPCQIPDAADSIVVEFPEVFS